MSTAFPAPIEIKPVPSAKQKLGERMFLKLKKDHGMAQGYELATVGRQHPHSGQLVDSLIAAASVNILVGDSGIGKSPMAYQLGLSIAAGKPFRGLPVKQGKVIVADYENNLASVEWLVRQQCRHLGIANAPGDFLFWPLSQDLGQEQAQVEDIVHSLAPALVIIDSLRAYCPKMETDSACAVEQIRKLRKIAAEKGTAVLLVHHVHKKQLRGESACLEQRHALDWLRRAAGARALINQTDSRMALARRASAKIRGEGWADLVLGGHYRMLGDVGPFLIRRVWDDNGDPLGYERFLPEASMLASVEQEAVFAKLGDSFTFGEARDLLGRGPDFANLFIHKAVSLGLAERVARGKYRKLRV
jgi:hypothetical protein